MESPEDIHAALKQRIDPRRVPRHIAIIMDGNGRWAERQGEHRVVGHASGVRSVREALVACREIGVEHLTL
ncbi:MAG TPA: undecaprenyl diphosphate synthase family protein, partial [Flavobacteriales bacterium]|nr:undecaprenyl diphosphate synthase family protein [Flavobacteriales bacterium]